MNMTKKKSIIKIKEDKDENFKDLLTKTKINLKRNKESQRICPLYNLKQASIQITLIMRLNKKNCLLAF
jgi:hypothetical protein